MNIPHLFKFLLVGAYPTGALGGLAINVLLAVTAMASGFVIGLLLALLRTSRFKAVRGIMAAIITVFRAIPLMLILFWIYFLVPLFAGKSMPIFLSAFIAITIYSAVNQAEVFRGGITTIDKGQWEAASSTGLSRGQCVRYVILPQVVHKMQPSFVSFFISMFKDTSIASTIGVIDLVKAGMMFSQKYPSELFLSYFLMGLFFFVICFALSRYAKRLEIRQQARYDNN